MTKTRYTRRDWLIAGALCLLALAAALAHLTTGLPHWGDDHSAYIAEAISIVDGRFGEQNALNAFMHPSALPEEARGQDLVYVWGYPLLLAPVYRAVGFDRVDYSTIICYKIPSALCLGLMAGVLYLFFRRRFGAWASAALALILYAQDELYLGVNMLYPDVPFMFFCALLMLLMEIFLAHVRERGWSVLCGALYGAALWYTREVRLNGAAVGFAMLLGHALALLTGRIKWNRREWWRHLLPYALALALTLVTERLWLSPATGNLSDVGRAPLRAIWRNVVGTAQCLFEFADSLSGARLILPGALLAVCAVIGMATGGFRENFHLTALLIGTIAVVCLMPYFQGMRYLYCVEPLLLLYAGLGIRWLWRRFPAGKKRAVRLAATALAAALMLLSLTYTALGAARAFAQRDARDYTDVYSVDAVDMYRYIQENLPEDTVIAFNKPRALYLNTGRVCFRETVNGHVITEGDYFLHFKPSLNSEDVMARSAALLTPAYENEYFVLFRVEK